MSISMRLVTLVAALSVLAAVLVAALLATASDVPEQQDEAAHPHQHAAKPATWHYMRVPKTGSTIVEPLVKSCRKEVVYHDHGEGCFASNGQVCNGSAPRQGYPPEGCSTPHTAHPRLDRAA